MLAQLYFVFKNANCAISLSEEKDDEKVLRSLTDNVCLPAKMVVNMRFTCLYFIIFRFA